MDVRNSRGFRVFGCVGYERLRGSGISIKHARIMSDSLFVSKTGGSHLIPTMLKAHQNVRAQSKVARVLHVQWHPKILLL
jgi:hypothetical protein